jgi:hypothetical protein
VLAAIDTAHQPQSPHDLGNQSFRPIGPTEVVTKLVVVAEGEIAWIEHLPQSHCDVLLIVIPFT